MAEETIQSEANQLEATKKRQRSPAYPSISLKECVRFIGEFYKKNRLAEVPKEFAMQHMGLDPKKGDSYRVTSAITGFGLMEETILGNKRAFKFTERGKIIVMLDSETDKKNAALQEAALQYEIIKQLRNLWPDTLPQDDVIKYELLAKNGFTERAAQKFVTVLRETYDFAKLGRHDLRTDYKRPEGLPDFEEAGEKTQNVGAGIKLESYNGYTLTLAKGKEIRLFTSGSLTQDEFDFMFEWIKRLGLIKSNVSERRGDEQP